MSRFQFMVDYAGPDEWSVGSVPGFEKGSAITGGELARVLRETADQVEKWEEDRSGKVMELPVRYEEILE